MLVTPCENHSGVTGALQNSKQSPGCQYPGDRSVLALELGIQLLVASPRYSVQPSAHEQKSAFERGKVKTQN